MRKDKGGGQKNTWDMKEENRPGENTKGQGMEEGGEFTKHTKVIMLSNTLYDNLKYKKKMTRFWDTLKNPEQS